MDELYAFGISSIKIIQYRLSDYDAYIHMVNDISNPYYIVQYAFPIIAAVDSVYAVHFLVSLGFSNWLNAVMKWWLLEDRPYWWIHETSFYGSTERPTLIQFHDTCETGPGSPSGHASTMGTFCMLIALWIGNIIYERTRTEFTWWVMPMYIPLSWCLLAVIFSRMYVAAHFPHQVLLGTIVGICIPPALCILVLDPFIYRYDAAGRRPVEVSMWWHVVYALLCVVVAAVTYLALLAAGLNPMWTINLAFRWCEYPEYIRITTSPLFALITATATLLGCAITITPEVTTHRYNTKQRSLKISILSSLFIFYILKRLATESSDKYSVHFLTNIARPALYLRLVPYLSLKAGSDARRRWLDDACTYCEN